MTLWHILKHMKAKSFGIEFFHGFKRGDVTGLAAQLAYYFLLSLFPFLIFLLTLGAFFIKPAEALDLLEHYVPSDAMDSVGENLQTVLEGRNGGLLSIGIIATLWSASNAINAVIKTLNEAYGVEECRGFIKTRLLALFLTIGVVFAFIVALVFPVFGKMLGNIVFSYLGLDQQFMQIWGVLRWIISFLLISTVVSVLYYLAPCKKLKFTEIWYGSLVATFLWQIVSLGFAFYIDHFGNYSATYGSIGAIIVLMLWFYLTGLVLLSGGVLNATFHKYKIDFAKKRGLLKAES
ncbi:YihY/virulence factor BrkB family protein [Fictibacillus barbaricus]|uniref:Membrane protein n=1 Tax=Fictibacillus barbaricus TaxID=182136 RepID=A0ABU1U5C3_9BACL|nr:YihY/virulence factor BrkB family protein [Fictibacillus barbaricus]MDR7074611.1 membrane protein [Fictibacillus barbaricus]